MDYQFSLDAYGNAVANFIMPHEAIGHWFNEELGNNIALIEQLLRDIDAIHAGAQTRLVKEGAQFQLHLDRYEAEVKSLAALNRGDSNAEDEGEFAELQDYDQEFNAGCGLIDFREALVSWLQFIKRG